MLDESIIGAVQDTIEVIGTDRLAVIVKFRHFSGIGGQSLGEGSAINMAILRAATAVLERKEKSYSLRPQPSCSHTASL